jgi:hypothetical protein
MFSRRGLLLALTGIVLGTAFSSTAFAQIPRYRPPGGSPIPAALDYFRRDVGVLDPYTTFVAPRRQLTNQLQALNARQQADFQAAESQISTLRQSLAAPTGVGGSFMNYSHYYPTGQVGRPRPR